MFQERLGLSLRRACQVVGQHRSTQRHEPAQADPTGSCGLVCGASPAAIPAGATAAGSSPTAAACATSCSPSNNSTRSRRHHGAGPGSVWRPGPTRPLGRTGHEIRQPHTPAHPQATSRLGADVTDVPDVPLSRRLVASRNVFRGRGLWGACSVRPAGAVGRADRRIGRGGEPNGSDVGAARSPACCSRDVGCRGDGSLELIPMVETSLAGAATEVVPFGEVEIGRDRPGE